MMMNYRPTAKGFSLIEVLIALFILAVGILGIIGLQLYAKQNNFDAIQRASAAALATDIVERMRMNKTDLINYIVTKEPVTAPNAIPSSCNTPAAGCAPTDITNRDLDTWYSMISGLAEKQSTTGDYTGGLTEPSACIIRDPLGKGGTVGQSEYRIVIAWRGRTPLSNSTATTCGNDSTGTRYGTDNVYRRVYVLDAKIE